MIEGIKSSETTNYPVASRDRATVSKSQDQLNQIAEKALQHFTHLLSQSENATRGALWGSLFGISDLTRQERVIVRDKIKMLKPEWNINISKTSWDMIILANLALVSSIQALEPGRDFWQEITDELERTLHNGQSSYFVTYIDYDKQLELVGWLKEKKPHWQVSIEEKCIFDINSTRNVPGKMVDILTVTTHP